MQAKNVAHLRWWCTSRPLSSDSSTIPVDFKVRHDLRVLRG